MDNYNKHWKKKGKIKQFFVGLPQFYVSCHNCNSFFFPLQKHSLYEQNQNLSKSFSDAQICHMSRSVLSVFFFPLSTLSTLENWADCAKASVCISRRPAFPTTQLSSPSMLRVYWSKQNESQDGHIEVSCDWLRWYSTESELLSKMTISSFFFFFLFVWTRCIVVPQFIPPRPQVGGVRGVRSRMEWRTCFLSLQWERENETEREKVLPIRPSIRVLSTHSSTPPNPGAAAMPIGEQEERGGAGSTDQGSVAISQCIDQWSGAVSGSSPSSPLHLPQSPPPQHTSHHISTHIRAAGPADRGAPPWPSTVRGWCSSGTDAGHLHVQKEGASPGQSRRGPWSLEGGPVQGRGVLLPDLDL